jgi:hypothetical protein
MALIFTEEESMRKLLSLLGLAAVGVNSAQAQSSLSVTAKVEKIYPYVVPREYLSYGAHESDGMTRSLGGELYVVLVRDVNGLVTNVRPEELANLKLSSAETQHIADQHLGQLIKNQTIKSTRFPNGPHNKPFVLFDGHWAAATSITWSGLHAALSKALGAEELLISIPHREAMIVFGMGDESYVADMKKLVLEKESDGRKPLTMHLFKLSKDGVTPFQ